MNFIPEPQQNGTTHGVVFRSVEFCSFVFPISGSLLQIGSGRLEIPPRFAVEEIPVQWEEQVEMCHLNHIISSDTSLLKGHL